MNLLPELGLGSLCADKDYFENTLGKYVIENGKVFQGYYGSYVWKPFGLVELNFHLEPEKKGHRVSGFTSNVSGNKIWRLAVTSIGDVYDGNENDEDYDPLSPIVNFTHPVTGRGNLFIHLVNADVVPSFYKGDVYTMQVAAVAHKVSYFADEDAYEEERNSYTPERSILYGKNTIVGEGRDCRVVGEVQRVFKHHSFDKDGNIVPFWTVEIRTPFGALDIHHSEDMAKVQEHLIQAGAIIMADCTLLGDVAVAEYQQGAIFDEEHIVRLLHHCFVRRDFLRASKMFADDCKYIGADGKFALQGGKTVFSYLDDIAKSRKRNYEPLKAYLARVARCATNPSDFDNSSAMYAVGTPCIAVSQQENGVPDKFFFIRLNEERKITEIKSAGDELEGYLFHYKDYPLEEEEEPCPEITLANTEEGWLQIIKKCYENGSFDDTSLYYGMKANCFLDSEINTRMPVYSRETMFTYLNLAVSYKKHEVSADIIKGNQWKHRHVLKVNIDGYIFVCAVDVDDEGKILRLHEYEWEPEDF